jgi:predicted CoA-binding protein
MEIRFHSLKETERMDETIKEILTTSRTIAVVGLSRDPSKPSYQIPEYLKNHGFHIVPVNPSIDTILGEKTYKSLLEMPPEIQRTIEVVEIFRPSADVPPIMEQAVKLKEIHGVLKVVWMQLGIVNEEAADMARKAGLTVVMDRCMMVEHKRLLAQSRNNARPT